MEAAKTILVNGISRSGTTLLATILDSHPDIAMCYEVLPDSMEQPLDELSTQLRKALKKVGKRSGGPEANSRQVKKLLQQLGKTVGRGLVTMVKNTRRSGVYCEDLLEIMADVTGRGITHVKNLEQRMTFSAAVMEYKRLREAVANTGMKYGRVERNPYGVYSNPAYVIMVRDPRDVLASRIDLNWTNADVQLVAKQWTKFLDAFGDSPETAPPDVFILRYEDLVDRPDESGAHLFRFLGVDDSVSVRGYQERAPVSSIEGVDITGRDLWTQEITPSRTGRWRELVPEPMIRELTRLCEGNMHLLGYQ